MKYLRSRPWAWLGLIALMTVTLGACAHSYLAGYVVTATLLFTLKLATEIVS